jgi:hypothetical protein
MAPVCLGQAVQGAGLRDNLTPLVARLEATQAHMAAKVLVRLGEATTYLAALTIVVGRRASVIVRQQTQVPTIVSTLSVSEVSGVRQYCAR